ncbi:hypothetical protein ACFL14_01295 [Patescibacteria group bacterium]
MTTKKWIIIGIIALFIVILGVFGYIYFSRERFVVEDKEWFQTGNAQEITQFQTKTSEELEDNKIGIGLGTYYREDANQVRSTFYLDSYGDNPELVYSHGFKWLRISFDDWVGDALDWQNVETGLGEYSIDPERGITSDEKYSGKTYSSTHPDIDEVISDYSNNGTTIVLGLNVGNEENHGDVSRFRNNDELERYSNYVRFMVNHFKGKIEYYEIWNEPGGEGVEADYINLIKHIVPIIREEDPEAKIVIGALAGEWVNNYPGYGEYERYSISADYIKEFLGSDIAPIIDAISWHPFYGTKPDDPYYQNYPQIIEEIKEFAFSNGFNGEYLAEELSWKTYLEENESGKSFSEAVAKKYYARAIIMHRGLDLTVSSIIRASGLLEIIPNICTIMAGATPADFPIEIQSPAENIESYTFSLSNGDKLIALWTDGVAVDDDSGVSADLTFDGLSGKEVVAVDVLKGYQQDIVVNGDKIKNLTVRDYPLMLKITKNKK